MEKCFKCGKEHPHYVQDFLIVSRSEDGGCGGMVTTTEQLSGAERHAVCRACLFKNVTKHSLLLAACTTVAGFFGVGLLFGNLFSRIGQIIFIAIALGCITGITVELISLFSRKHTTVYLEDYAPPRTVSPLLNKIYVPVGDGLYKSERAFKKDNYRFVTDIGTHLYAELIATGRWKDYVAAALIAEREADPMLTAEVPEGEYKALLTECVQELLRLYRQTPGGFLTNSAEALPVRTVGKRLDEAGGFKLMLQAHGIFAASNPGMGLARNLEMVWDGIGGWRG